MALVISGIVAPMAPGAEQESFRGRVWLGEGGEVDAVTRDGQPAPAGFAAAPVVEVGDDATVYPGLVDLHSHVAYNSLPLWVEPGRTEPYLHHDSWPGRPTYDELVSWSAWTLLDRAPECVLAYLQVRALAGGTTAIQGWPGTSRRPTNQLVRSVDDDQVGPLRDPVRVSALTLEQPALADRAVALKAGRSFVYHCAEGQPGSLVAREFTDLAATGCLRQGLVGVHCTAVPAAGFQRWREDAAPKPGEPAGAVVWSPFSNLWLYGTTTPVPDALAAGLAVCLGTDWGPSGTKNLLGELKAARLAADHFGWPLADHDLARMVSCAPGDALARAWRQPVGRLVASGLGDVAVIAARWPDPWQSLVAARESDVRLVVVGGKARYGTTALMTAAGAGPTASVRIGQTTRRVTLVRPEQPTARWPFSEVLARLDAVRADAASTPPSGPVASGRRRGAVSAPARSPLAGDPPGTPPMAASLDMPGGGLGERAGPPPVGRTVRIPPVQSLRHDQGWFASVRGRGFHGGVLDGLADLFRQP